MHYAGTLLYMHMLISLEWQLLTSILTHYFGLNAIGIKTHGFSWARLSVRINLGNWLRQEAVVRVRHLCGPLLGVGTGQ